jgi:hypothetical protein
MTDGNTHAIAQHLDEREDWDALQEVTAELEQAEARIAELEAMLAKAVLSVKRLSTSECFGSSEVWGLSLSDSPLGREILARMDYANTTLAELKGQDDE